MPRVKTGTTRRARHNKLFSLTKGYYGTRNRLVKSANEAVMHAGQHAYIGRKNRKRDLRSLWITRINAAVRMIEPTLSYSKIIPLMKKANIQLDRKVLAELAVRQDGSFEAVIKALKA